MKKILCLVLALSLLAGLLMACNSEESAQVETDPGYKLDDSIFDDNSGTQNDPVRPSEGNQDQVQFNPTQSQQDANSIQPTTGQQNTTAPNTEGEQATEPTTPPADSEEPDLVKEYEAWLAMTSAQKQAYQKSFSSYDAFFEWYNAARDAHKAANPPVEIGKDGTINMDDLTKK